MMFKNAICLLLLSFLFVTGRAATYYMAPNGNDNNPGTIDAPFATINKVQTVIAAGDTVYFRGGTYTIQESQIMGEAASGPYKRVFVMDKSGTTTKKNCYWGYPGERPVFDLSQVNPTGYRVTVFFVSASDLHFKNFEITGTQVNITTSNTQSECFRHDGGNRNIYENLAMHDGMAIGFYLVRGLNNLVLNCDAYNNYDPVSQAGGGVNGGNVDGFGGHTNGSTGSTGNVFRGCRAWYNSDDGFDLIGCLTAFTIENCWAFNNGYKPPSYGNRVSAGDGTGFKAGGYGMGTLSNNELALITGDRVPMHIVKNCLAYYNKNRGFYSNHHLGGIYWENNTGYRNPNNFDMTNRQRNTDPAVAVDVAGYGHVIKNNVSYSPRTSGRHIYNVSTTESTFENNSFLPTALTLTDADFISLNEAELTAPRKADGSLPDINFLRPVAASPVNTNGMGYLLFDGALPADFGTVSATIRSGDLSVKWSTLFEKRNSYFEVEASSDGVHFSVIGKVASKAADGNLESGTSYEWSKQIGAAVPVLAASFMFLLLGGLATGQQKRRWFAVASVLVIIVSLFSACKKNGPFAGDTAADIFIRIRQVDQDGAFKYSRIIKAVEE